MTREQVKQRIMNLVEAVPGCKVINLCTMPELIKFDYNIGDLIDELVKEKNLIEVEYILPTMDYRIKSILFPYGTSLKINGK